jgi:hypothetical protein
MKQLLLTASQCSIRTSIYSQASLLGVVVFRKDTDDVTPTALLSLEYNPAFPADICHTVRWVCTQALKQSGTVGILAWMNDMPWRVNHTVYYLCLSSHFFPQSPA